MKNSSWLLIGFPISLKKSTESAVVVGLSGEVIYHPASGERISVQEGSVLADGGELELGANAKVTLFYDGKRHLLNTEGKHALSQVLKRSSGSVKLKGGFAKKFEEQLLMAFATSTTTTSTSTPTSSPAPTPSTEEDKEAVVGWGTRSIIPITPADTTVGDGTVLFLWISRHSDKDAGYTFQLYRSGSEEAILQATLREKKLLLDLAAFAPQEGEEFYWTVSSGDNQSEKAFFTYRQNDEKAANVIKKVREEEVYKDAGAVEKMLMEAVALKEAGFAQKALQRLQEAASRYPGNQMVTRVMDNFVLQIKQQ